MRVLAVFSIVPHPENRGGAVRNRSILRVLSGMGELEIWCVQSNGGDADGLQQAFPDAIVRTFPVDDVGMVRSLGRLPRYLWAAVEGVPVWIRQRASSAVAAEILSTGSGFDRIVVLGEATAHYLKDAPVGWHWDKVNMLSVSGRAGVREASGLYKAAALINWLAARRFERRLVSRAGTVSVTNSVERSRFERYFPDHHVAVVPTAVPIPDDAPRNPIGKTLLWLGNFSYESNFAGLLTFLDGADTKLRDCGWTLRLVGSGLTGRMKDRLRSYRSVIVVGFVEDLRPEFEGASAGIVPLWSGGGTKIKTLTMLAAGLPVVATTNGVEGVSESARGSAYLVGETPEQLVDAVEDAFVQGALLTMSRRARELAVAQLGDDALRREFRSVVLAEGRDG